MTLSEAALWRYALPLARPLAARDAPGARRRGLLLRLRDGAGNTAWGEAAPLPGHGSETLAEAEAGLERACGLVGQPVPEAAAACTGALAAWLAPLALGPAARCAVETAALGLLAAARGVGLRHLLDRRAADRVAVAGLIAGDADPAEEAHRLAALGHPVLKLKLSGDLRRDLARIAGAAEAGVPLRLDANRAYAPEAAAGALAAMVPWRAAIAFVEEPSARLPADSPLPLALDESLVGLPMAAALARVETVPRPAAVVLKPALLGLETTVRLARAAGRHGMAVVISSAFESGLGTRLCAEIAAGCAAPETVAGLGTLGWFAEDLVPPPSAAASIDLHAAHRPDLALLERVHV